MTGPAPKPLRSHPRFTIAGCAICAATFLAPAPVRAGEHGEIAVGRTLANQLVADIGFPLPAQMPRSIFPGFTGYATALVGFADVEVDDPAGAGGAGLYRLSLTADITARLTHVDTGIQLFDGPPPALATGGSMTFGSLPFDYHPVYTIPSPAAAHGPAYTLRFILHDNSGQYADSSEFTVSFTPACPGDFNLSASVEVLDIFDFLTSWFLGERQADADNSGTLTVQDIFAFLNHWFAPCP